MPREHTAEPAVDCEKARDHSQHDHDGFDPRLDAAIAEAKAIVSGGSSIKGLRAVRTLILTACLSGGLFLATSPMLALDPSLANTQYGLSFWLSDDGLPQNTVSNIAQTPDGYLWFATEEGLARFDGVRFTTFFEGKTIGALLVSRDGSLWISLNSGLARYKNHVMTIYSTKDGLRRAVIVSMSEAARRQHLDGKSIRAESLLRGEIQLVHRDRRVRGKLDLVDVRHARRSALVGNERRRLETPLQGCPNDVYNPRRTGRQHRVCHPAGSQGRPMDWNEQRLEQDAWREDHDLSQC